MRQSIKTFEFTGKLEIDGKFFKDNVRCVYRDDYYSNKTMEGEFYVDYLSAEFLNSFKGNSKFVFEDKSNRVLKGVIYGFNLVTEYNERRDILNFNVDDYLQRMIVSDKKPKVLEIIFHVPYVSLFSREIKYSFDLDESYLFKYKEPSKKFCINNICVEFVDKSYLLKDIPPNSKFVREIFPKIKITNFEYSNIKETLDYYKKFIKDLFVTVSFILNKRVFSFGFDASLLDEDGKLTEFINSKHKYSYGDEFLKTNINQDFESYFSMSNLSLLLTFYRNLCKNNDLLERIIFSYISINELSLFEARFKSAFSTLEGISKLIVKPKVNISSEQLIKEAFKSASIEMKEGNFEFSESRKNNESCKLEWLISEYRNYLTHFNDQVFDMKIIGKEFGKIMKLTRRLIFYYMSPDLVYWPEP